MARRPTRRGLLMSIRWRVSGLLLLTALLLGWAWLPTTSVAASAALAPAAERPSWQTLPLVDARSGEAFPRADLDGKTVYVEPMATWCTNCRQQMGVIRDQLVGRLDPEQAVLVGLSVE